MPQAAARTNEMRIGIQRRPRGRRAIHTIVIRQATTYAVLSTGTVRHRRPGHPPRQPDENGPRRRVRVEECGCDGVPAADVSGWISGAPSSSSLARPQLRRTRQVIGGSSRS